MTPLSTYRHIIWDFNGTLIDDLDAALEIQRIMLAHHHLAPLDRERYLKTFDFPIIDWYAYLGYDISQYESLARDWSQLYESCAVTLSLCPGAQELLTLFAQNGLGQSVLSASNVKQLNMLLEHLGILDYFDPILGLDNSLAGGKTGLCGEFQKRVTVPPEQILLIGDTTQDALTADLIGCDCALVACGHQCREKLSRTGAAVFDDHFALYDHLSSHII